MKEITYHKATLNDVSALVDSRIEFLIDFWGQQSEDSITILRLQLENYFSESISDNTYISYLAKFGGVVVGGGGIVIRKQPGNFRNPTGRVGYLVSMYTVPAFRKRGICTTILNALLKDAHDLGVTAFELHATREGEPVYRKNGFVLHPEPTLRKYIGIS